MKWVLTCLGYIQSRGEEEIQYLYDWVSSLEQSDGQQDALLKDTVAGGVHDEVDDQVRCSLSVQMTLDLGQTQLPSGSHHTSRGC